MEFFLIQSLYSYWQVGSSMVYFVSSDHLKNKPIHGLNMYAKGIPKGDIICTTP